MRQLSKRLPKHLQMNDDDEKLALKKPSPLIYASHFVNRVRQQIDRMDMKFENTIVTTLDGELQEYANMLLDHQLDRLKPFKVGHEQSWCSITLPARC